MQKNNYQEILFKKVIEKKNSSSLTDEIATVLNISYDAAHRRITQKSKLSIEETILLCNHYNLSMDQLFKNENKHILEKTKTIKTTSDFKDYLDKSNQLLKKFNFNATAYYSAKDIPLHYTIGGTLLSKFKLYVWLTILNAEQDVKFENFIIEEALLNETLKLTTLFQNVKRIEIWNDTTINSSLQQVYYFYQAGLITIENAQLILKDIQNVITTIEKNTQTNSENFELFYNELLLLNNTVLFTDEKNKIFFIPHNMLSYYSTTDNRLCKEEENFLLNQIKSSKSISKSGTKDQKIFFNRMYQKIDFYQQKIANYLFE